MTADYFPQPHDKRRNEQSPVEAPRVDISDPTAFEQMGQSGFVPGRKVWKPVAGVKFAPDASVTVPDGVVIQVCPSFRGRYE